MIEEGTNPKILTLRRSARSNWNRLEGLSKVLEEAKALDLEEGESVAEEIA